MYARLFVSIAIGRVWIVARYLLLSQPSRAWQRLHQEIPNPSPTLRVWTFFLSFFFFSLLLVNYCFQSASCIMSLISRAHAWVSVERQSRMARRSGGSTIRSSDGRAATKPRKQDFTHHHCHTTNFLRELHTNLTRGSRVRRWEFTMDPNIAGSIDGALGLSACLSCMHLERGSKWVQGRSEVVRRCPITRWSSSCGGNDWRSADRITAVRYRTETAIEFERRMTPQQQTHSAVLTHLSLVMTQRQICG